VISRLCLPGHALISSNGEKFGARAQGNVLDDGILPSPGRVNDLASSSTPIQAQRMVNALFTQPAVSRAAHSYEQSAAIDEQYCPGREGLVCEERVAGRDLIWAADRPREIRLGGMFVVGRTFRLRHA
jgi:hypothetical protein